MAGYSGTPLASKLGIKAGFVVRVVNAPDNYARLLAPLSDNVRFVRRVTCRTDLVHVFTTERRELKRMLQGLRDAIAPATAIWVSWPKKSANIPSDVNGDAIREVALPLGLVDIKVCAVDDVWSGLKLVIRKELRCEIENSVDTVKGIST